MKNGYVSFFIWTKKCWLLVRWLTKKLLTFGEATATISNMYNHHTAVQVLILTWNIIHDYITRDKWVNSLWPSDTIWHHGSWSTLVQVTAWYQWAPSHLLNHCWLSPLPHTFQSNLVQNSKLFIEENACENVVSKTATICTGISELTHWPWEMMLL